MRARIRREEVLAQDENDIEIPEDDRRTGEERRGDDDDPKWQERRSGDDRRAGDDRRGLYYTVRYTNPEAIGKLREWLEEHCKGEFEIAVPEDNLEEVRKWGNYRVKFELKEDRTLLARLLGVHWPKWMG